MARTTSTAVEGIIEVDSTISLTPFIEVANALVTELCSDSSYTDARLELIERWLSAHFYAVRDLRTASERAGKVGASYQHKVDLNLAVTVYGQQAMLIDTDGNLAALNAKVAQGGGRTVGVTWLGTGDSEGNDDTD